MAVVPPSIEKEPDALQRVTTFPKRKSGLSSMPTRARFVKPRPNINLTNKASKEAVAPPTESNNVPDDAPPQSVKTEPEIVPRPVVAKRTAVAAVPRARFQRARPNISSLNKPTKDVRPSEEERSVPPVLSEETKSKESSSLASDVLDTPTVITGSVNASEGVKSPITVVDALQEQSVPTTDHVDCGSQELPQVRSTPIIEDEVEATGEITAEASLTNITATSETEEISATSSETVGEFAAEKDSPPSSSVASKNLEYPTLKSILNSPRKRTATKKAHERRKRVANFSNSPSRSEMTMLDLIYWNPAGSPMKCTKPKTKPFEEDLLPPDENTVPPPAADEPEEDLNSAPKVIINEEGEIILDESSLVVRRKNTVDTSGEAVVEHDNTTYSSFRKRTFKQWSKKETVEFYKALSIVGTDFAFMESMFQKDGKTSRTRRELKLKFKREEKCSPQLVHKAIYERQPYDINILENDSEEMTEISELVDDAPKRNRKATTAGTVNRSGRGRKKKVALVDNVLECDDLGENAPESVVEVENERIEASDSMIDNDAARDKNVLKPQAASRPGRLRKAKTLTDFVTDIDNLSDANGQLDNDDILPLRKRKRIRVLSEEMDDPDLAPSVDANDQILDCQQPSQVKNNDVQVITVNVITGTDVGPVQSNAKALLPVGRRKKFQPIPRINRNKNENNTQNDELIKTVDPVSILSCSARKRKAKPVPDFITDTDDLNDCSNGGLSVEKNQEIYVSEKSANKTDPKDPVAKIAEAVNNKSDLVSAPDVLIAECSNVGHTEELSCSEKQTGVCSSVYQEQGVGDHAQIPSQDVEHPVVESFPIKVEVVDAVESIVSKASKGISSSVSKIANVLTLPDHEAYERVHESNLLTDAVISEVVTSDKMFRRSKKKAAPNIGKASHRPPVQKKLSVPQKPSFANFTPMEEDIPKPLPIKTYSNPIYHAPEGVSLSALPVYSPKDLKMVLQSSSRTIYSCSADRVPGVSPSPPLNCSTTNSMFSPNLSGVETRLVLSTSKDNSVPPMSLSSKETSLDVSAIDPNTINMTPEHQTDSAPMVIFTKSPNNENILHLFMYQNS